MNKKALDPAFWEKVRTDESYAFLVQEALALYAEFEKEPLVADLFSKFKLYGETGDRAQYQGPYFRKRKRLNVAALLSVIYPQEPAYLEMLEDVLWSICDEYAWSLPAHLAWAKDERTDIDLFAAETAYALSEIVTLLRERLHKRVYKRVCEEIWRRIIESYENHVYDWESVNSNWAAVCAGSVGTVYMYMAPERFAFVKDRLHRTLEGFLEGFSEEGVCYEGQAYWTYGFGFFVAYAQQLYDFTEGKENFFLREKVRKIADFPRMTDLGGVALSFSDSSISRVVCSPAIYGVLQLHYPDIRVPAKETYEALDGCARWCRYFDAFVYLPKEHEKANDAFEYYCEDAGWFIKRNANYGFAAKAGTNDEMHNHNDIAGFIFAKDGKQLLCDLGAGQYDRGYFSKETRYTYLCNGSQGHSVPIIDGCYQSVGAQYKGEMKYEGGAVEIAFGEAYDTDVSAKRKFTFDENGVTLKDTFDKKSGETEVTERFVTCVEPWIYSDGVWVGDLCLQCNAGWLVEVKEDVFVALGGVRIPVYFIDYTTHAKQQLEFEMRMTLGTNPNPLVWEETHNAFLEEE